MQLLPIETFVQKCYALYPLIQHFNCPQVNSKGGKIIEMQFRDIGIHSFNWYLAFESIISRLELFSLCVLIQSTNEAVFTVEFNPNDSTNIITCGKSHVYFWTLSAGSLTKKQGIFGVSEIHYKSLQVHWQPFSHCQQHPVNMTDWVYQTRLIWMPQERLL